MKQAWAAGVCSGVPAGVRADRRLGDLVDGVDQAGRQDLTDGDAGPGRDPASRADGHRSQQRRAVAVAVQRRQGRAAAGAGARAHLRGCLAGARWVADNILERYQDPRLRVYVVWVRRWATDARSEIDGAGMVDPRVVHFWDSGDVIGRPFLDRLGVDFGGLDYDFFLLFDRDASWGASPPRPVSSGATVVAESDRLADGAASLLR